MKNMLFLLSVSLTLSAGAQSFEVASIRPCAPGTRANPGLHNGTAEFDAPGGKLIASATNIQYLMEWAYDMQAPQHSAGPDWMATECYDIAAQVQSNATRKEIKQLTRTLLEDRFQLKLHRDTRKLPAIVVSLGKSAPKMTHPQEEDRHEMKMAGEMGPDQKVAAYHVGFVRYTLGQLNDVFARVLNRVIVDQTGLEGEFNFTVNIIPDETRPNPMDPTLLVTALREDLGLKLDSKDAEVDFWVIDNLARPSGN